MIDTVQLERELTTYFAAVLNLTVDTSIFRGAIPETVSNGAAVRVESMVKTERLDTPTFSVHILGKFLSRDDAWVMLAKCAAHIPKYGESTPGFILVSIVPEDESIMPYAASDHGVQYQYASVNIRVRVLTRAA